MKTNPGSLMHLMPLDEAQHQISCCMALLMTLRSELQNLSAEAEAQSVFKVQHISLLELALEEANRNIELAYPQWCKGDDARLKAAKADAGASA